MQTKDLDACFAVLVLVGEALNVKDDFSTSGKHVREINTPLYPTFT